MYPPAYHAFGSPFPGVRLPLESFDLATSCQITSRAVLHTSDAATWVTFDAQRFRQHATIVSDLRTMGTD